MKKFLCLLCGIALLTVLGCFREKVPVFWNFSPADFLENKAALRQNTRPDRFHWNEMIRPEDKSAPWQWSSDRVLASNSIDRDAAPGELCPVLKFAIPIPEDANYSMQLGRIRDFRFSTDCGKSWQDLPANGIVFDDKALKRGNFSLWLAPAHRKGASAGPRYLHNIKLVQILPQKRQPVKGFASKRVEERLDRGLAAWDVPGGAVYLSWRLLKEDAENIAFDLFEITPKEERKCNTSPIADTTDFCITAPAKDARYEVRPAAGFSGAVGKCTLQKSNPFEPPFAYRAFRLADPWERISKVGIGDLDGDGAYDFVVRHSANYGEIDPAAAYWRPSEAPCKLTAFRSDGTRLWTRSLGWNVEKGIWYAPFLVADLDGDGKAEVIAKTSDEVDRREQEGPDRGKVLSGPEYVTVFNGMTGEVRAQAPWPERTLIQEGYGRISRNQLALAYLDGKTPFLIAERGTYGTMLADAWEFRDGKLRMAWSFDNRGAPLKYWGQGAHTTLCMDVDKDGRDEVILGSSVIDDDGSPLWSTGHGHPDRILIAPIQGGDKLLYAEHCETPCRSGGINCCDAATGAPLWELKTPTKHLHTGWFADCDARCRGWLGAASDLLDGKQGDQRHTWTFAPDGSIQQESDTPEKSRLWGYWDADLQREKMGELPSDYRGGPVGGGFQGTLLAKADVLGDWREEVLASVPGELRIYATTIPAYDRRICLMQDPNYRATVRASSTGYLPETMLSYLPTDRSVGFSMVRTGKNQLEVTVSAPLNAKVSGEVTLSVAPVGLIDTVPWQVSVEPGKSATRVFSFHSAQTGSIQGTLYTSDGKVRKVSLPLQVGMPPQTKPDAALLGKKTVLAEAAKFTRSSGDRGFVSGHSYGSLSTRVLRGVERWIEWDLAVPQSGTYTAGFRYASTAAIRCAVTFDGKGRRNFTLEPTGGFGRVFFWRDLDLPRGFAAKLTKGTHSLRLCLLDDPAQLQLDCVWLTVPKE